MEEREPGSKKRVPLFVLLIIILILVQRSGSTNLIDYSASVAGSVVSCAASTMRPSTVGSTVPSAAT